MKRALTYTLFFGALTFFLSNCASLTGFQDGKTVGQGNGEFSASLNFSGSPNFGDLDDGVDSIDTEIPTLLFPSFEFGGRYGVADRVDLTLRLNTNLNLGLGAKVQVLGDQDSKAALALGAEVGTFGLVTGLWNVQVPVYFSIHPTPKFAWYASPRYIYQFTSYTGAENGLRYLGGNTGFLFGERNKFGIDLGYYNVGADDANVGTFQIGIGGRFRFGNN